MSVTGRVVPPGLIWATRGRSWGFRFLLDGGFRDPLPEYDRHFAEMQDETNAWLKGAQSVAMRFPDPLGRQDASGRVIPHEFVVRGDLAHELDSPQDGLERVWPLVADSYARVWGSPEPPSAADLGLGAPGTP